MSRVVPCLAWEANDDNDVRSFLARGGRGAGTGGARRRARRERSHRSHHVGHGAAVQLLAQRAGRQPDRVRDLRRRQRDRLGGQQPGRGGLPGRQLLGGHQRPGRRPGQRQHRRGDRHHLRLRRLRRQPDHLDERRRLPARPGDDLPPRRSHHLDHQLRRRREHRRARLRDHLQPGLGDQPDRRRHHRRPAALGRAGAAEHGVGHGAGPRHREPRLRGAVGQVRRQLQLSRRQRAGGRGRLRPALRAHAGLLEEPAGARSRRSPRCPTAA